jgi:peptidylprolyl isomerase
MVIGIGSRQEELKQQESYDLTQEYLHEIYQQFCFPKNLSELSPDQGELLVETFQSDFRWSSRGEPRLIKPDAVVSCRFEIQLNDTECPRAVKNFKSLCEGTVDKHGKDLHYQNTMFHRFVKDFCLQGGDINGKGGDSIYSGFFKDEKGGLKRKHDHVGVVSMANSGPHTNRSQFFFTLSKDGCQSCDGKHVVVGRVVNDEALRFLMENVNETLQAGDGEVPTTDVFISSCGIAHCK